MADKDGMIGSAHFLWTVSPPPHAQLNGDRLEWWYDNWDPFKGEATPPDRSTSPKRMLDNFVSIRTDKDVLRFAQRFGVMFICQHGLPATHSSPHSTAYPWDDLPQPGEKRGWCMALGSDNAKWSEGKGWNEEALWAPLDSWFHYVGLARAILNLGIALHSGQPGAVDDWKAVLTGGLARQIGQEEVLAEVLAGKRSGRAGVIPGFRYYVPPTAPGRLYLSSAVSAWLYLGNVRPSLVWPPPDFHTRTEGGEPVLELHGGNPLCVFGPLGVQLMVAVSKGHAVAICSGCGNPYLREGRKPQAGRKNFCPECGELAANRLRQREWRRRKGRAAES